MQKVKRAGGVGLWGAYVVDQDVHGLWLYTPERSLFRGTMANGEVVICHSGQPDPPGTPSIHLIPTSGWWLARWQVPRMGAHVAVDICTPAELDADVWSYDDLELDLLKFKDGTWRLDDEDEFDDEVAAGRISSDERELALATTAELQTRLATPDELFDQVGWENLARYSAQSFAPLIDFP